MHYNAEITATLAYATIAGWKRIKNRLGKFIDTKKINFILPAVAVASLFLNSYVFKSPGLMFFNKDFYKHSKNFEFLDRLVDKLPEEGTVWHNIILRVD
jgi:multisubunit Na+/H+ antiporter MnhB subunit